MDAAMIRRQNLARIVGQYRTQQEFADLTGTSVQYLNQLLNGTRNIGEKSARKLEKAASLAPGSLDQAAEYLAESREPSNVSPGPPSPRLTPSEREMVELIRGLTPEQQSDFKQSLEDTQRKNKAIFEALSQQFKSVEEGDEK